MTPETTGVTRSELPEFVRRSELLEGAYRFARDAHHGDRRKGDTDIDHPVQVASLLDGAGFGEEVVAAALLHDVIEDTATDPEEIRERYHDAVAELVSAMTEDASVEPYEERKAAHRERIRRGGRDAAAIYAADKLASARRFHDRPDEVPGAKLEHYERTLGTLRDSHPDLPFLGELEGELRAIRRERS
jgi:(p)ppGpp synthase/HD superfamily hydrolase